MSVFGRFFKPYAEYCLRTAFSEDELKSVFRKELPSYNNLFAVFKAGFDREGVTFFRSRDPLKLHPGLGGRNSLRGEITIRCERSGHSPGTVLHITIAPPPDTGLLAWIMLCFSVALGILALCAGAWQALFPALLMPGFLFMVLAFCRWSGENEVPKIRGAFESTLRKLEEKYRGEAVPVPLEKQGREKIGLPWMIPLLILPPVLVVFFDRNGTLSLRNFLSDIFGTVFLIDLPVGMCLLHYYRPQFFRSRKSGDYSIVPWAIFFFVCWGIVALDMFLETRFGRHPENGFAVFCAYVFGWMYIWFTMIPVGLLYLLLRFILKLRRKTPL